MNDRQSDSDEVYIYEMPGKEMVYTFLSSNLLANISSSNRGTLRQAECEERRKAVEKRKKQREASQAARWRQQYTNVMREIAYLSHRQYLNQRGQEADSRTLGKFALPSACSWRADAAVPRTNTRSAAASSFFTHRPGHAVDVHMAGVDDADRPTIRRLRRGKPPLFLESGQRTPPPLRNLLDADMQSLLTSPRKPRGRYRQPRGAGQPRDANGRFLKRVEVGILNQSTESTRQNRRK
ncbi:hypothetical protein TWF696_003506 [Orbilia brochopaga]|uniref:Uncharacterized protein n=1 Tax=Orbilia brochopaga TaxID=3140254 RepID=A0AAV9TWP9_9PEZI